MSVYRVEVSWDGLSLSPTGPVDATWDLTNMVAGFLLTAVIHDHSGGLFNPGMRLILYPHSFGGGPTYELMTQQQATGDVVVDFVIGTVPPPGGLILQSANGDNGAAFLSPASQTIAFTIDEGAQTVAFTGVLGTITQTFAALGWASGTLVDINLDGIAIAFAPSKPTVNWAMSAAFFNFYLSKDGTRTQGAQLGSAQPGIWSVAPWAFSNLGNPGGTVGSANGQTATRLLASFNWDHTVNVAGIFELLADWNTASATKIGDVEQVLALLCHSQHGALAYARVIKQSVDAIEVGVSHDSGHTWTVSKVGQVGGRYYLSPSLAEAPDGSFDLFIHDLSGGPTTRWFKSDTFGLTWNDNGILLDLLPWSTSTHPKVFTLFNGFFLVSYNRTGHWFLAVYDGGLHASTGIKTTDMGANTLGLDTFPGLHEDGPGNAYAIHGGLAEQLTMSTDYGVDWADVYNAPAGSKNVVTASSEFSPYIWKIWQDAGNNLMGAAAKDGGGSYLYPAVTVIAGIAAQYVGLTILPLGRAIELHQNYNAGTDHWDVAGFTTSDLGVTWQAN